MRVVIWVFYWLYVMVSFRRCDFFAKTITHTETANEEYYIDENFKIAHSLIFGFVLLSRETYQLPYEQPFYRFVKSCQVKKVIHKTTHLRNT